MKSKKQLTMLLLLFIFVCSPILFSSQEVHKPTVLPDPDFAISTYILIPNQDVEY